MNKRVLIFLAAVLAVASLMGQVVASEASKPQMKTRMEALEPFIVMGLEAQNAMEGEAMMEAWTKFFSYYEKLPEPVDNNYYGIYYPGEKFDLSTMQGYN